MSEHESYNASDDLLDRAAAALRDVAVPEGPSDELLADTLSALRQAQGFTSAPAHSPRRILTMKLITKLAVAAVLAIVIGGLLLTDVWKSTPAFAEVLEKIQGAKSVRFTADSTVSSQEIPGAPKSIKSTITIVGSRMRQEMNVPMPGGFGGKTVQILDYQKGEMLSLTEKPKKAFVIKMQNVPKALKDQNLLDRFRTMKPADGKSIGRKEVGGQPAEGYEVAEDGQKLVVWADMKTRLPVRIEITMTTPLLPKTEMAMTGFQWDVPVDESLLSTQVPAGYDVQSMNFDMSEPTEKDLLNTLRQTATLNNGKFPEAFGMSGLAAIMKGVNEREKGKPDKQREQALVDAIFQIGRGFMFVDDRYGSDFHYAGKGVEFGQKGRPVFWYLPAKSEKYRVIDADLSVHEASPAELPTVEAQKLPLGFLKRLNGGTTTQSAK